jgi:hypothetical protein
MLRKMVVNAVLFVFVCHVFNDLILTQWQYWATIGGLIGIWANSAKD